MSTASVGLADSFRKYNSQRNGPVRFGRPFEIKQLGLPSLGVAPLSGRLLLAA